MSSSDSYYFGLAALSVMAPHIAAKKARRLAALMIALQAAAFVMEHIT